MHKGECGGGGGRGRPEDVGVGRRGVKPPGRFGGRAEDGGGGRAKDGVGRGRPQGGRFTCPVLARRRNPGHSQPLGRLQGGPLREHGCTEDAFPTGSSVLYFYFLPPREPPPPLTRLRGRKGNHFFTRARFINPLCCVRSYTILSDSCKPWTAARQGSAVRGTFPRQEH